MGLYIAWLMICALSESLTQDNQIDVAEIFRETLYYEIYIFIIFLFVSCEFMSQAKKYDMEECLRVTDSGMVKHKLLQISIMAFLNAVLFAVQYIFNIIVCVVAHTDSLDYIVYMGKALLIYSFGVNLVAILLGAIIAELNSASLRYISLVLFAFLAVVKNNQLDCGGSADTLLSLEDFSQIFCASARWITNYAVFNPVELHFAVKPIYFIAVMMAILFSVFFAKTTKKHFILLSAISILIGAFGAFAWTVPCGGGYMGYQDNSDYVFGDERELLNQDKENANFYVENYEINLDIRSAMKAECTMRLSESSLLEYHFIFYRDYDITSIADENGESLNYTRAGNKLTVENPNRDLRSICITYQGRYDKASNYFYTGKSGAYLPGNFPYYPIAGCGDMYQSGLCQLPEEESAFLVKVKSDLPVYSNLEMNSEGVYRGQANQVSIVAGKFWKEENIDGVDYIYPYISYVTCPDKNSVLKTSLQEALTRDMSDAVIDYTIKDKKILISPYSSGMQYMFGSDMVVVDGWYSLDSMYNNYVQTGSWYKISDIITDDEIRDMLKDYFTDEEIDKLMQENTQQAGEESEE
jgi:hypothetical protein